MSSKRWSVIVALALATAACTDGGSGPMGIVVPNLDPVVTEPGLPSSVVTAEWECHDHGDDPPDDDGGPGDGDGPPMVTGVPGEGPSDPSTFDHVILQEWYCHWLGPGGSEGGDGGSGDGGGGGGDLVDEDEAAINLWTDEWGTLHDQLQLGQVPQCTTPSSDFRIQLWCTSPGPSPAEFAAIEAAAQFAAGQCAGLAEAWQRVRYSIRVFIYSTTVFPPDTRKFDGATPLNGYWSLLSKERLRPGTIREHVTHELLHAAGYSHRGATTAEREANSRNFTQTLLICST